MISHLSGKLKRRNEDESSIQLDVHGVWYEVDIPAFVWRALEELPLDSQVELEIYYFVTSNTPIPRLIGFQREVEREFFKKLIDVPNVGPSKAAKALVVSVSTVAAWIENGDSLAISGLPGIGKRSADVIVAQLRGKVVEEALLSDERFSEPAPEPEGPSDVARDAIDVLSTLGYSKTEAERLVMQVESEAPSTAVEEIIRAVFRRMNASQA